MMPNEVALWPIARVSGSPERVSAVAGARRRRPVPGPRPTVSHHKRPAHMMGEDMFRTVLIRERKRADRTNQSFVLLLLDLSGLTNGGSPQVIRHAAAAAAAAKRETDVMGWFSGQSVIGLILPQVREGDVISTGAGIEGRLRHELAKRLGVAEAENAGVRLHVHPEPKAAGTHAFDAVDPLLQNLRRRPAGASINDALKRTLDVLGSTGLLILFAPLMLVIAALVKATSKGPVFFRQDRIGQNGKPFKMLKFRSMRPNAGSAIHQDYVTWFIKSSGEAPKGEKAGVFKIANDPRITPIGRFIRNTSLDELPQFLNVLFGEMSLVGPRPPLQYEVDQYKPWHCRRVLEAKPGITGLWQVTGRSRTTFDEMVRLDLRYAKSSSLWTDIKILLATPKAVISGKGAC
jgi:lipopolysaccharide/colanic/teichoic acid biosynthesis glycosyltransferase